MEERILDKELEKKIRESVDAYVKTASKQIDAAKAGTEKTKEDVEEAICERPLEWVFGAFVAGLIVGKLLSK